jgi:N-acylneuraminate cytidylyltransferase
MNTLEGAVSIDVQKAKKAYFSVQSDSVKNSIMLLDQLNDVFSGFELSTYVDPLNLNFITELELKGFQRQPGQSNCLLFTRAMETARDKLDTLAIITARGGSKRIPRKNIRPFFGKPIIGYPIENALNSHVFSEVMVSTDDVEIADYAKKSGAEVPFLRGPELSNDHATTAAVLLDVIEQYKKHQNKNFKWICCLYPTTPLLDSLDLQLGMSLLRQSNAHSVLPIVKFGFPPQRGFVMQENVISYTWPEHMKTRSQDLPPMYHDAGQFYCVNVANFLSSGSLLGATSRGLLTSEMRTQDVDVEEDWALAEMKWRYLNA